MPRGKGIAARGDLRGRCAVYGKSMGLDFIALTPNLLRSDAASCIAAGLDVYAYTTPDGDSDPFTPDSWMPSQFARTIPAFEMLCARYGLKGYYADTEWPGRDNPAIVARLATMLRDSARRTGLDIIVTDFYADEVWSLAGAICGGDVALSLQLYDIARTAAQIEAIFATMKARGWEDCFHPFIPFYKWVVQEGPNEVRKLTPAEFTSYVSRLPALDSAIGWYPLPAPTGALAMAMRDWQMERRGIIPFLMSNPVAMVAIVVAVLFALVVVLFIAR